MGLGVRVRVGLRVWVGVGATAGARVRVRATVRLQLGIELRFTLRRLLPPSSRCAGVPQKTDTEHPPANTEKTSSLSLLLIVTAYL